jgi:hypothetical protein
LSWSLGHESGSIHDEKDSPQKVGRSKNKLI